MTEEIKEILDYLKNDNYETEAPNNIEVSNYDLFKMINSVDNDKLLNYITNLQKENENLKNQLDFINEQNKYIDKLEKMIKDYKQKNEKAVEYINNLRDESAERQGFYNCFPDDLYIANIEDLLNILQGGDE